MPDDRRKAAGTRGYMDDRATPPLCLLRCRVVSAQFLRGAGGSSGLAHQNSPVALFNRWNRADEGGPEIGQESAKGCSCRCTIVQVKTQAMLDQHQKEWEQKNKELDQTKKEIQDQARALEKPLKNLGRARDLQAGTLRADRERSINREDILT